MRQNILQFTMGLLVILASTSCTEERDEVFEFDLDSSRDHAQSEAYWNDIFKTVDDILVGFIGREIA